MKDEREKRLLFKRHKAVRFLISPKKKKEKIEVNKIMNPAFLFLFLFLDNTYLPHDSLSTDQRLGAS